MKNAIIDIGSNSVRLLFNGKKYTENTQLAESLMTTGVLKQTAMERTAEAVKNFYDFSKQNGAEKVYAFATEAVRSASNGKEFVLMAEKIVDEFELVPSGLEAEMGFKGAYTGEGTIGVLDIGGASSELAIGDRSGLRYAHSLPLGSVRLKDFAPEPEKQFEYAKERVKEYGEVPEFEKLYSIGGSISVLFAVKHELEPYDSDFVHHSSMSYEEIKQTVKRILDLSPEERKTLKGMHPKKIFVAPAGGLIALAIMEKLNINTLVLSETDNLEGYATLRHIEV